MTTKTIHFLRHAHGEHNAAGEADPVNGYLREDLRDAKLSNKGLEQCNNFASDFTGTFGDAELVVVSPMTRTLQTATLCFPDLVGNVPFAAHEMIREQTGKHPCDNRQRIDAYKDDFPHVNFDHVEHLEDPLYHLYPDKREPKEDVCMRGKKFFDWLWEREESNIIVVTHSAYLLCIHKELLQVVEDDEVLSDPIIHFQNCEVRSVIMEYPSLRITVANRS